MCCELVGVIAVAKPISSGDLATARPLYSKYSSRWHCMLIPLSCRTSTSTCVAHHTWNQGTAAGVKTLHKKPTQCRTILQAVLNQRACADKPGIVCAACICSAICSNTALSDVVVLEPEGTLDSRADPHAVGGSDMQNGTKHWHAVLTGHIPATHSSNSPCARAFVHAPVAANNKCFAVNCNQNNPWQSFYSLLPPVVYVSVVYKQT